MPVLMKKCSILSENFFAVLELGLVEVEDVVVADTQPRGVELELGFLLAGDADADLAFLGEGVLESRSPPCCPIRGSCW